MAARKAGEQQCREFYILIEEAHCLGFSQARQWTVRQWKKDQGLAIYNEMNDLMLDILSLKRRRGKALTREEKELFYMACYDLDRFRDLTFEKRLWEAAPITEAGVEALRGHDGALMRFAMEWIKGAVFGSKGA
jgi:hypothetical protein